MKEQQQQQIVDSGAAAITDFVGDTRGKNLIFLLRYNTIEKKIGKIIITGKYPWTIECQTMLSKIPQPP